MDTTELRIIQASQQFQGFLTGRRSGDIIELITEMGLTKDEWNVIKDEQEESLLGFTVNDVLIIEDYFNT